MSTQPTAQNRDLVLSDEDLAEIAERAEKAIAGPWKLWGMQVLADPVGDSNLDTALMVAHTTDTRYAAPRTFNAQFIAAARTDVPSLVAALTVSRQQIEAVRAAIEGRTSVNVSVILSALGEPGMSDDEIVPRVEAILLAPHDGAHDYATEIVRTVREAIAAEIEAHVEEAKQRAWNAGYEATSTALGAVAFCAELVRRGEQQ